MDLFHVAYNGYVWKALFLYRHPERSGGIFLAGGDNVVCVKAENENASAKGARRSGVQGRFLAALEMTVWGDGFISRSVQRICWENATSAMSSRAKWRDLSCTLLFLAPFAKVFPFSAITHTALYQCARKIPPLRSG